MWATINLKKNGYVHMYIHFSMHLKLTQYCKSTIPQYQTKIKKINKVCGLHMCS